LIIGVRDVLGMMRTTPTLFKTLTNFTLEEFDELAYRMVSAIIAHARSICELFLPYFMFLVLIFEA
jgi:hypothetical protein